MKSKNLKNQPAKVLANLSLKLGKNVSGQCLLLYLSSAKDASSIEKNEETLISWEDYRKK